MELSRGKLLSAISQIVEVFTSDARNRADVVVPRHQPLLHSQFLSPQAPIYIRDCSLLELANIKSNPNLGHAHQNITKQTACRTGANHSSACHSAGYLAVALTCLLGLALPALSFAAGLIFHDGFEDGTTNQWQKDDY